MAETGLFAESSGVNAAGYDTMAADFGRLYEENLTGVYRYVFYRVGEKETAEDLTSDIFNRALSGFSSFDPEKASFATWVFTIARNVVIDYFRKKARENRLRREPESDIAADAASPEEEYARTEETQKLHECLAKLKENEREIVSLKFGSGITNREIARITGLSESNVGTILCRAIRKLRDGFSGW